MSKPIVIIGTALLAEQMHFYFAQRAGRRVEAFAVDAQYLGAERFCGQPVLEFEEALRRFGRHTHEMFVAIGFLATEARKQKVERLRALGYTLPTYVHPSAWVAENVRLGVNTLVQEQAVVAPFAELGDDVFLCPQVGINHHTRVGAHCFFAPAAVVAGDASIGECCFVGANATIRDRVTIGARCVIGAGAVIMEDCAEDGLYAAARTARRD
jgi:sugar O-acyltransferase (sialic acid O-acetyltransferase NeuD family)